MLYTSPCPIISSADIFRINGKSDFTDVCAIRAVFPENASPSSKTFAPRMTLQRKTKGEGGRGRSALWETDMEARPWIRCIANVTSK